MNPDANIYPTNVVTMIQNKFTTYDTDLKVVRRQLRATDPTWSVGVFASSWEPDNDSREMGQSLTDITSIERFYLQVQGLVRSLDEETGLAAHTVLAATLRHILVRDVSLRSAVLASSVTFAGLKQSARRLRVMNGRYISNQINKDNVYLTVHDIQLEVETTSA